MAITFYYGSGSPYAWRVWLALEHKGLPYELKILSFSEGDLRNPEFQKLNPRRKVPVIVDDGFALYESVAILEYLQDRYPEATPLLPLDIRRRAVARRLMMETDWYLGQAIEHLVDEILFKPARERNEQRIAEAKASCLKELAYIESVLHGDYLAGEFSAADLCLYPLLALLVRIEKKRPDLNIGEQCDRKVRAWMRRIESLPYFDKTYPPHWREVSKV